MSMKRLKRMKEKNFLKKIFFKKLQRKNQLELKIYWKIGKKLITNTNSSESGKNSIIDNQQKEQKLNTEKAKNGEGKKGYAKNYICNE